MAEILKTFAFRGGGKGGGYPWDEWLDGKIRRLVRGQDFRPLPRSFRQMAHLAAKYRNLSVRFNTESEKSVVIQAIPRDRANGKKP